MKLINKKNDKRRKLQCNKKHKKPTYQAYHIFKKLQVYVHIIGSTPTLWVGTLEFDIQNGNFSKADQSETMK